MNKYSVLQNFKNENLKLDPFPYIYIPEVLPWDLYEKLEAEYPEEYVTGGSSTDLVRQDIVSMTLIIQM